MPTLRLFYLLKFRLARERLLNASCKGAVTMEHIAVPGFLALPRELRDMIYSAYCDGSERKEGALQDYVFVPSPALLGTCKQIRRECSPVFYRSLQDIISQPRVIVNLSSRETKAETCCGGWRIWTGVEGRLNRNIFIRAGDSDERSVVWWMDIKSLTRNEEIAEITKYFTDDEWTTILHFATALKFLAKCIARHDRQLLGRLSRIRTLVTDIALNYESADDERPKTLQEENSDTSTPTMLIMTHREAWRANKYWRGDRSRL